MDNENIPFEVRAGAIALSLRWAIQNHGDVIKWADEEILKLDELPEALIQLSLARNESEALKYLGELSRTADYWDVLDNFLKHVPKKISFEGAKKLSRHIFEYLCQPFDWPSKYSALFGIDDDFYLCEQGVLGMSKDEITVKFMEEIERVVGSVDAEL